jgi:hypothetical protein
MLDELKLRVGRRAGFYSIFDGKSVRPQVLPVGIGACTKKS